MRKAVRYLAVGVVGLALTALAPEANARSSWSFGFNTGPGYYPSYSFGYYRGYRPHHRRHVRVYAPPPCYGPYYYGPGWGGFSFNYFHR